MFTQGTKQFGIWKIGHPSGSRYSGRPTQSLLLAYGCCTFITWLILILSLKVRGEFFLIESLNVPLHRTTAGVIPKSEAPPASVSVVVRPAERGNHSLRLIFDDGQTFFVPEEISAAEKYLRTRVDAIELGAMLKKVVSPHLGTVDFWVDQRTSMQAVQPVSKLFVQLGFDTVRYVVDAVAAPAVSSPQRGGDDHD
jgi:hypothetical protein